MTTDPNTQEQLEPMDAVLELTAEVERLRAELALEDARKTLMGTRIEQIQAIVAGASGDPDFDVLDGSIEAIVAERDDAVSYRTQLAEALNTALGERDDARAQAALLAEALEPFARRAREMAATDDWWEKCRAPLTVNLECIASRRDITVQHLMGARVAIASTDASAWLREEKIAELELVAKEMKRDRWDAETACIEARIAELRREEGADATD